MATFAATWVAVALASSPWAPLSAADAADEALAFSASLLAEKDTYRAITELKRFAFLSPGPKALHADLLLGQLYAEAGSIDASRFHFSRVMESGERDAATAAALLNLQNVCITRILSGNCEEEVKRLPEETPLGLRPYYLRYWQVLMDLPGLPMEQASPELRVGADTLEQLHTERRSLSLKSPAVAGVLSALLPGAGQAYNGRYVDAGLALGLTGLTTFGAVSLLSREQPDWALGVPLGLFALVFYTGNIVNAVGDAFRMNENTYRDFSKRLQRKAWPQMAVSLGPHGASFILLMQLGNAPPVPVLESPEEMKSPEAR
jgi:TM2 domain-containing membrane protein YozV